MLNAMVQNWWTWALGGAAAILFGIHVPIWLAAGLAVLIALFGAFALANGIFALGGVTSTVFSVVLFARSASGALALIWLIGIYAIVFGVVMLIFGFRLKSLQNKLGLRGHGGLPRAA